MRFVSDNTAAVHPKIMAAIAAANRDPAPAYGGDDLTKRLTRRFSELFEKDVTVLPVATGTAANSISLAALCPSYGAVFCHREAHVEVDECGAPEFYTGGAKLVALDGAAGKLDAKTLDAAISNAGIGVQHHVQPAAISLTNATEAGTLYRPDETAAIGAVAKKYRLGLHVDGARFANAVAALNCRPADLTWKAGVDLLSFGATKGGAMAAEAAIAFTPEAAQSLIYRRKRGGHLFSKMRFLSAQLEAYLTDGLWLEAARHANRLAQRLKTGLERLPGVKLMFPVEANEVFVDLPAPMLDRLYAAGWPKRPWPGYPASMIRLVASGVDSEADVDAFLARLTG
ncbi:MAG: low specificity L-threonine aldolase [Alphaproteobacteria bacterium]|nr:low specificity L-threonine aldolase [Alphaproteobacteria bacterium]